MTGPSESPVAGGTTALVLLGGGARAAYQVGFLRCLAQQIPETRFPILVGVSSGAINVAHLASRTCPLPEAAAELSRLWGDLTPDSVMRVDALSLAKNVLVWGAQLFSGGRRPVPGARSLVDCGPLEALLRRHLEASGGGIRGIDTNLRSDRLAAVALTTTCYSTADSVTFVQGRELPERWSRPGRIGIETALTVDHVLASGALPFIFPAVRIGRHWHGDGGVRLSNPLAPAIGLGADRIVVISTDAATPASWSEKPRDQGYPPPAEIVGTLFRSQFHDRLNDDLRRLRRINRLLDHVSNGFLGELRRVRTYVLRPSMDPGALARQYESRLPRPFRFMTRGLGTRYARTPDLLSMVLFEPEYLQRLMDIGERDARGRGGELKRFLEDGPDAGPA